MKKSVSTCDVQNFPGIWHVQNLAVKGLIFHLWVNATIIMLTVWLGLSGLFQIQFLGSCSLSVNWKISLISLARYTFSGQSDMVTDSSFRYGFVKIQFQINCYRSSLRFSFKLIVIVLQRSSQILFTRHYQLTGLRFEGWVGGRGEYCSVVWKLQ